MHSLYVVCKHLSVEVCLCVAVTPTITGSGPEGSSEEVTVTLNSPTSLVCEAQSYPPAIITWLKDGTPFESSRNVRVLPGTESQQYPTRALFLTECFKSWMETHRCL